MTRKGLQAGSFPSKTGPTREGIAKMVDNRTAGTTRLVNVVACKTREVVLCIISRKNFIPCALWFKKVALQYAYGEFSLQDLQLYNRKPSTVSPPDSTK